MRSDRARGFILPTTLLVMTLLTVMLTAGFVLSSAEQRSADNSLAGTRALSIAQAGMQSYFASNRSLRATNSYDSLRYTYSTGYTDVVARKMESDTTGPTNWIIKSTAIVTDPLLTDQIQARRTIGQMAVLYPGTLPARAALVALNGVHIRDIAGGSDNPLNGTDHNPGGLGSCTPPPANDTNALATVTGMYSTQSSPPLPNHGIEYMTNYSTLYDSTHIDWVNIVAGNFTPDWVGSANLPAPVSPALAVPWKVGFVQGDLTIPSPSVLNFNTEREGVLIVTGNLRMANYAHWDGIVLVGGNIQATASTNQFIIHGYAVSGLNCVLTAPAACTVPKDTLYRNYVNPTVVYRDIKWSWCWSNIGVNVLSTMVPTKNTFMDNWANY